MKDLEKIPIPKFSEFVINNGNGIQTNDGIYYHFSEVISILKKYDKQVKTSDYFYNVMEELLPNGQDFEKYCISPSILEDNGRTTEYEAGFKDCLIEIYNRLLKLKNNK